MNIFFFNNFSFRNLIDFSYKADGSFIVNLLSINLLLPLFGIFIIGLISITPFSKKKNFFKIQHKISLWISAITFMLSLLLLLLLNKAYSDFQGVFIISFWNMKGGLAFGVDFISMSLNILTNLFIYLCILSLRESDIYGKYRIHEIIILLFFIQWGLLCAFSVLDLLGFFIFFEATLVPIFLIILRGGSRERKVRASFLIALYTLLGSIFMLFNMLYF